jgi:hypothetical protein
MSHRLPLLSPVSRWRLLLLLSAAAALPSPALAWDYFGHQVVARIAWNELRPETRAAAVALLMAAPDDAHLACLLPPGVGPLLERQRTLFDRAATWPDVVRDEAFPERQARYHHGPWHYRDRFWEQPDPSQPPRERMDLPRGSESVVERLRVFSASVGDTARPAAERAIELAWILHLVGDIHQPLHTTSRVTPTEPTGDRGANMFELDEEHDNLHWYWDGAISRSLRHPDEPEEKAVARVAAALVADFPRASFAARLALGSDFERWAEEGYLASTTVAYPPTLRRGQRPPGTYRQTVERVAEPAAALAGYRLAALLEEALEP